VCEQRLEQLLGHFRFTAMGDVLRNLKLLEKEPSGIAGQEKMEFTSPC